MRIKKNSKFFGDYLIEIYGDNAIKLYWSENNALSPYNYTARSQQKVWIKCQENDKHPDYEITTGNFYSGNRCPYCKGNKVIKEESFGFWLEQNNMFEYWGNKNDKDPYTYSTRSNKKFWAKCPNVEYHPEYEVSFDKFYSGKRCPYCAGQKVVTQDSFGRYLENNNLIQFWGDNNELSPFEITVKSNRTIWMKCEKTNYHKEYKVVCNKYVIGVKCSYCGNHKVHKNDSLGVLYPESINVWSNKNKKTPYDYKPKSRLKMYWKCDVHGEYFREISSSTIKDFRCPQCTAERTESIIQEQTRVYLNELGYNILHEHQCKILPKNPKTGMWLPFDNEVVDLKLVVEVHGRQHYELVGGSFHWLKDLNPEQYLHKRKLYDRYKRLIAHINKYEYLEIPYWEFDDDTYKQTILDKIESIRIKGE
jgi:hypothetical protein